MSAKAVMVFGLVVILAGCATVRASRVHLDRQKSVLVALPADAESPSYRYLGSGQSVAHAVAEAFAGRGISVEVAKKPLTNDEAMAFAARTNAGYVVLPLITHWEQRNEWLALPSRLALWVSVIDTATGKVVMAGAVKSRSIPPLAFTIESPEALLEKPLSRYVSNLY
jgi:hypothetical protein